MTNLAPHADQAVRHAVDAYIDGRLLPNSEGNFSFETRNSKYLIRDGVLLSAPNASLLGAELVGWLVEFPSRSEISCTWKPGVRAILVDTRNDGVKGPHIIVTSATRAFRSERAGSLVAQGGSSMDQGRPQSSPQVIPLTRTLPPPPAMVRPSAPPPPPTMVRPASAPPPAMVRPSAPPPPPRVLPRVSPPPPVVTAGDIARRIAATVDATPRFDLDDSAPTGRSEKTPLPSRVSHGASMSNRSLPPGRLPARMPPPPASVPFMLSRSFQRGMPLR